MNATTLQERRDLLQALIGLVNAVDGSLQGYGLLDKPMSVAREAIHMAHGNGTLCSPDNPPFDTLEPTPSLSVELYRIGQDIRKRHPAHCRCSSKVVTAKLTTIMRDTGEAGQWSTLLYIDRQHAKWCASEAWTKEGGKYAKSLEAWLSPTRRLWENEPLLATAKAEYVDRYAMESGGAE